jgi:hypothetical protein
MGMVGDKSDDKIKIFAIPTFWLPRLDRGS